jgi:polyketide biosynthesis enoyl-CoA hydratase PksH
MPACVMPFLKRRVGFQQARWMALSAASLDAARAERIGLVDQVADRLDEAVRRQLLAVERVPARTFARIKAYADRLSPIDATTEDAAVGEIASLLDDPANRAIIEELMRQGVWQGAGTDRVGRRS